jgi:hypothetical protein
VPISTLVFPGVGERRCRFASPPQARRINAFSGQVLSKPRSKRIMADNAAERARQIETRKRDGDIRRRPT